MSPPCSLAGGGGGLGAVQPMMDLFLLCFKIGFKNSCKGFFFFSLPAYLKRLPVPESITGFARLTVSEWLRLLPFLGVLALLGYLAIRPFLPKKKQQKDSLINLKIQKENPKVVNEINIEDLCLTKAAYCRCWRSKTFPACDGSHNKHNELTGDNVGPLILKKKEV